jgi:hypothetical protein
MQHYYRVVTKGTDTEAMTCLTCQTLPMYTRIATAMPGMQQPAQPMMQPQAQPMPIVVGVSTL